MALWKPFRGTSAALADVPKTDGHAYFCTDDGSLFFDYKDENNELHRKQINETLIKNKPTVNGVELVGNLGLISSVDKDAPICLISGQEIDRLVFNSAVSIETMTNYLLPRSEDNPDGLVYDPTLGICPLLTIRRREETLDGSGTFDF